MKISRLIIKNFQQFQNFDLDLTYPKGHPKAGAPLNKCCFIGRNGTGKSTLLRLLAESIQRLFSTNMSIPFFAVKITTSKRSVYYLSWSPPKTSHSRKSFILPEEIENSGLLDKILQPAASFEALYETLLSSRFQDDELDRVLEEIQLCDGQTDLLIDAPSEAPRNTYMKVRQVPPTTLSEALVLFKQFPFHHVVSQERVKEFWNTLIYHIKKRENEFREFEQREENLDRTVRDVKNEFEKQNPFILDGLAELWNNILDNIGLEFDIENAKNPVQLEDNLQVYIRLKSNKEQIPYNLLSTGIRNFIFQLGHIYSLYFQRDIQRGFLLVDEPENSLYPDFLYDLVDLYEGMAQNTQIFMATHNPIISAQFEASERIILEFQEDGSVTPRKGHSPEGDDPNDLLLQDFGVRSLYGKEGQKQWKRFVELQKEIPLIKDRSERAKKLDEYMNIGTSYNFPIHPAQADKAT